MKNETAKSTSAVGNMEESSKLLSLLALAASAAAIPQTGNADIIFTDLSTNQITIGPNAASSFLATNLPGTAQFGFGLHEKPSALMISSSRWVTVGQKAGYVRLKTHSSFVVPVAAGLTWNQVAGVISAYGLVGFANYNGHTPNSFDHMYLAFRFKDSTQVGSPLRYGWIEVSLSNPTAGSGPDVTVFGYAYDNTGALIPTGLIPEPAPPALLALGALMLGAKGVRQWRRQRQGPQNS